MCKRVYMQAAKFTVWQELKLAIWWSSKIAKV